MSRLTRIWNSGHEDPVNTGHQEPSLFIDYQGWLCGDRVKRVPADPSWYSDKLWTPGGTPLGVVWHYTATDYGTAKSMAKRRTKKRKPNQRAASWHVTVDEDGTLWQSVSFEAAAWHCRGKVENGGEIYSCNRSLVGIELEGHGDRFPSAQIEGATELARALVSAYDCKRPEMVLGHRDFDPGRRADPGPIWSDDVLPVLLDEVFRSRA